MININVSTSGSVATIHMNGRFDFNAHRSFKEACDPLLQQKEISSIEINLSGVEYMDSSALGMLLLLRERAETGDKAVALVRPNTTLMQILNIANFKKLFPIR